MTTSLNFRLLLLPLAVALLVVGVMQLRSMPVDVLPEFSPPYVEIQTEALGLSANEVEQLITVPLEQDLLNGVAGIDVIRSESVLGLSSITLVFEDGTDLLDARQLVQERLIQARILPNVAKPPVMLQPLSSESRVMMIGLSSTELSLIELGVLARWTIRPRLLGVPGVANVVIWGQREHQVQVQVDPVRLNRHGVTLEQIVATTGNAQLVSPLSFLEASTPGTGGFIDTPNQRLQVRHILPIAKPEGLAQVPVDAADGKPAPLMDGSRMRLGDVTDVVIDHQPLIGDAVVDGGPGLLLVVEKFRGANTLELTRELDEALDAMRPGLAGVEPDAGVFRPSTFIESAIDNIGVALLVGLVLLAGGLVALFFEWRIAAISLLAVPLSLLGAVIVLSLRGESLNALVLAGLLIALGVVVSNVVVVAETASQRLRSKDDRQRPPAAVVADAAREALAPLSYATLIALAAVVPVFFLDGTLHDFFGPLALSYVLALLASLAVALTLTPALSLMLAPRPESERRKRAPVQWLAARYDPLLRRVLAQARPSLLAAAVVLALALLAVPMLMDLVIPAFKERNVIVRLESAPGTSRPEALRLAREVGRQLSSIDGVSTVGGHVGRAVMGDRVRGVSSGELWVTIDPDAAYDATLDRIRNVAGDYPGVADDVVVYSTERVRAVAGIVDGKAEDEDRRDTLSALTGADEALVVRIYGPDLETLHRKAEEMRRLVSRIDGVVGPRVESQRAEPTIEVEPNLVAARQHGMKPGDIRRAAATLVQGIEVGSLFEQQKVFEVIVTSVPDVRRSVTDVRRLLIDTPEGDQVELAQVADVQVRSTPAVIKREATSRYIDVVADVSGRGVSSVVDDVEERLADIAFPLEYRAEVLRVSIEHENAARRILFVALAAALGAFLLLQAAFGSWRLAAICFVSLPIAVAGGIVALVVDDNELSLGAAAGLLTVFAIALGHTVVLIDRYRRLGRGGAPVDSDFIRRGARDSFGPVLMASVALGCALIPFVVVADAAGFEIAHPLAVVVLGGLITMLLYTLFVVPVLYLLVEEPG